MKQSEQDRHDLRMLSTGAKLARILGNGYRVLGVNPGYLLISSQFPQYPLNLPETLVEDLVNRLE